MYFFFSAKYEEEHTVYYHAKHTNLPTLPRESHAVWFLLLNGCLVITQNIWLIQLWQNASKNLGENTDMLESSISLLTLTFKKNRYYCSTMSMYMW